MVYVFLANGCEEVEALTPVDILRRGGVEVTTIGIGGRDIVSSHGVGLRADIADSDMELHDDLEAVVLPGGMPGTNNLASSEVVRTAVEYAYCSRRIVAAICAAPTVLKTLGILDARRATVYPSFIDKLGSSYIDRQVFLDENVLTGRGVGAAFEFSLELLKLLKGESCSQKVRTSTCF